MINYAMEFSDFYVNNTSSKSIYIDDLRIISATYIYNAHIEISNCIDNFMILVCAKFNGYI